MTSHMVSYLFAIQEQEIATRQLVHKRLGQADRDTALCRHCRSHPEDIAHIVGSCPSLASSMYLPLRHDQVAKTLNFAISRKADPTQPFKNPEGITNLGPVEIWWDQRVTTAPKVMHNKPDMIIWNHREKTCRILEVGVPLDCNVPRIECEKASKYIPLQVGLKRLYPHYHFDIATVIIGATGHATKNLLRNVAKLGFKEDEAAQLIGRLQERAVMGTIRIVKAALQENTDG